MSFARTLIDWQRVARAAPRLALAGVGRDPYRIWLAEIMLQQTQGGHGDSVLRAFSRALFQRLPISPLRRWEGCDGAVERPWVTTPRARNLHRAAQQLVAEYGGHFPRCAADIAQLPGVGRSTAAAVAAFACGERAAILDGNVKRVLCRGFWHRRVFPASKAVENRLWALAESLLPEKDVGIYIQAQMDLGATVCTRAKPRLRPLSCGA